jgi:uncharacterized protein
VRTGVCVLKGAGKSLDLLWGTALYIPSIFRFAFARRGTTLRGLLSGRPALWTLAISPFVCSDWTAKDRFRRVGDHSKIVDRLIPPLARDPDSYANLATLKEFGSHARFVIDQPRWLTREGLLTFSLWSGVDRIFSLTFCFTSEDDQLSAVIGGLQGSNDPHILLLYRDLTKTCSGMRPKDMLIELSKMMFAALGIEQISATSNRNRYTKSPYFAKYNEAPDAISLDFDEGWLARGGILGPDQMFTLSTAAIRRSADEIPARKRKIYGERYRALDAISAELTQLVRSGAWLDRFQPHQMV